MQYLGLYVVSLTSMALISGLLLSILQDGPARTWVRFLSSVMLIIIAISPWNRITFPDMTTYTSSFLQKGMLEAEKGTAAAHAEYRTRIKNTLEEYICEQGSELGTELNTTIFLDEECHPISVQIRCDADKGIRQQLQTLITKELGIRKENQEWIGQTEKMP